MHLQLKVWQTKDKEWTQKDFEELVYQCRDLIMEGKSIVELPMLCQTDDNILKFNFYFGYHAINLFYKYTIEIQNSEMLSENLLIGTITFFDRIKDDIFKPIIPEWENMDISIDNHKSGLYLKEIAELRQIEEFFKHLKGIDFKEPNHLDFYFSTVTHDYFDWLWS